MPVSLCSVCCYSPATTTEQSICSHMAYKTKMFTVWHIVEQACQPLLQLKPQNL